MTLTFRLNEIPAVIEADADERLVDILRKHFNLTSMKKHCMQGICGSCTVLLDNTPVPSCMIPAFAVEGKRIVTLELFETTEEYAVLSGLFKEYGITLCGFCTASTVLTAHYLLNTYEVLNEQQIRDAYIGTVCRCTDITQLVKAISAAANRKKDRKYVQQV